MQNLGLKKPPFWKGQWSFLFLEKFTEKFEILSIHDFLYRNFAAVCRNSVGKLQLPAPHTFLTHDAAGDPIWQVMLHSSETGFHKEL